MHHPLTMTIPLNGSAELPKPHGRRSWRRPCPLRLRGLEIDRRGLALLAAFELIANPLAFDQMFSQPRTLDGGDMDEHVLRAVFGLDENS